MTRWKRSKYGSIKGGFEVWSWKLNGVMFNVVTAYTPDVGCQKRKMNYGVSWMK